jgi:hypothetical protein
VDPKAIVCRECRRPAGCPEATAREQGWLRVLFGWVCRDCLDRQRLRGVARPSLLTEDTPHA